MEMILVLATVFGLTYGFLYGCNRLGLYLESRGRTPRDPRKNDREGIAAGSEARQTEARRVGEGRSESLLRCGTACPPPW